MSHLGKSVGNGAKIINSERKFSKKYYKKTLNLLKEYKGNVTVSKVPTPHLFVGNGGILCGKKRHKIITLFKTYGSIIDLIMVPQKSYSFLSYKITESASKAMSSLNNYIFESDEAGPVAPLYLQYLESPIDLIHLPSVDGYPVEGKADLINDLLLKGCFISEKYEKELIDYFIIHLDQVRGSKSSLKHRTVKHFGFEFLYTSNNIDRSKPLSENIPDICKPLLDKILMEKLIDFTPDQLTVNQYQPGQGIPPHTDTHSAFEDGILSLTLNNQVTMEFGDPNGKKVPIILPQRSLLIMKGESRYLWTHGITPRSHDIYYIQDSSGTEKSYKKLTLKERGMRISLTFRKILHKPCCCIYKKKCDSQNNDNNDKKSLYVPDTNHEAIDLEEEHVNNVYEEIAEHFSGTRHTPWPRIKQFLCDLKGGSLVADIGCGNGKYLGVNPSIISLGSDRSINLVNICNQRGFEALVSDCLNLPYRSNTFDASICIAVIHHLSTEHRRLEALKELVRITNVYGLILVYVWALEQNLDEIDSGKELQNSNLVEATNRLRIEVNEGRNIFQQQDLLVPWHLKEGTEEKDDITEQPTKEEKVFHRFYHVFKQGELEDLCKKVENVELQDIYFDKGNWCAIMRKNK